MSRLDLGQGHVRVSLRAVSITPCSLLFPSQSTQHAAVRIHNQDVLEVRYYYVRRTRSYQGENLPKCLTAGSRVSVKLLESGVEQGILVGFGLCILRY